MEEETDRDGRDRDGEEHGAASSGGTAVSRGDHPPTLPIHANARVLPMTEKPHPVGGSEA
ncbi:hypothetical protein ATY41_06010 [Leifsonia xyli subsp. xyli]|uniref:Uncharacterized protein n=1 Tax=Leifsonia xyli subsp. xyli TaxID=59736 RepID=A0A1E2SI70_LEIXY|nr:hypothetical protein ATY41_06010 [Leifsonia xyli subsp. xyli]